MMLLNMMRVSLLCAAFLPFSSFAVEKERSEEEKAMDAEKALYYKDPPLRPITEQERKEACQKYDKSYISFHDNAYWVKDCQRFLLSTQETADFTKNGVKFREVDGRMIAAVPDGGNFATAKKAERDCREFQKSYVSHALNMYWVEDCVAKKFPDDATLQNHRRMNKTFSKPTQLPSIEEFAKFKDGGSFPSVFESEREPAEDFIEVLPIEEACHGIESKHVAYLDTIYFIESFKKSQGCWRRAINASEYTKTHTKLRKTDLPELSSSQAVSIPDQNPEKVD